VGSFGDRLKKTRENRKITLDEVAKSTKISTRMLRALEEEKFDQLPGGVFNKGFVRAYARQLGLDEEKTVADYMAIAGGDAEPKAEDAELRAIAERKAKEKERQGDSASVPWGVLAILLLVVALGLSVWGFYSREQVRNVKAHRVTVPVQPTEKPVSGSVTPATVEQPAGQESTSANAAAGVPSAATAEQAAGQTPASTPVPVTTSYNPSATPSGAFVVMIIAHQDSWVSINADGKSVFADTLAAPAEKSIQASHQVILRVGNAGGLAIFFNGKRMAPFGEEGETRTLTFGVNGLESAKANEP
jgi:cytoskeletal protein RodZ